MTRTEERLTDALAARAAAVAAHSIRPLPAPEARRFRHHSAGRRWSMSLAPLAAAASIATITAVVGMLPQHHAAGHGLTGMPKNSMLLRVAAVSASDAWAVGMVFSGRRFRPLIMHWNGTDWTRSPISAPGKTQDLWDVAAASPRDAWAVGSRTDRLEGSQPSIFHWNGAEWAPVPAPRIPASAYLTGVAVVSVADAWAVGNANGALILHWNGTRWRNVPNPWLRGDASLFAVFAKSADDVWAVGRAGASALILRWNGRSWTRLGGPNYRRYGPSIAGVAVVSSRLAWLVGNTRRGLPLILRWNGSTLRQVSGSKPTFSGGLTGVSAVTAGQAWAVADCVPPSTQTRIFRWQGHSWRRVPHLAGRVAANLCGVFALSARNVWAVGYTGLNFKTGRRAVILHWNGTSWRAVA